VGQGTAAEKTVTGFVLAMIFKSTIIAGIALIVAARARNAASAALTWRIAFISIVTLPILSLTLPSLPIPTVSIPHDQLGSSAMKWLEYLWIAGSVVSLIRLVADYRAARNLLRGAMRVDDPRVAQVFTRAITIVVPGRIPTLRLCDELPTAALLGWLRPVIILPKNVSSWTDEELLGVLCHELEHSRHCDWAALILERVTVALMWINPLMHLAFRSSSAMREMRADDAVVRSAVSLEGYAARLIAAARETSSIRGLAASIAFSGRADTETRVHALFETRRQRRPLSSRAQFAGALLAFPVLLGLAALEPWRCIPSAAPAVTSTCP
jgi:beta-lactamase regulating signal transducer with metallopeptidase domain